MIITYFEQGSPDWHASRCGIPTASRFADVLAITPDRFEVVRPSGTRVGKILDDRVEAMAICEANEDREYTVQTIPGGPMKAYEEYLLDIACQRMTGKFCESDGGGSYWTERGHELEPLARSWYEFQTDQRVSTCGLILNDERTAGASLDGLVDIAEPGNIEIKCLKRTNHMRIVLENKVPDEFIAQVQGGLYVTGNPWCDFVPYNPDAPVEGWIIRVHRDEDFIARLDREIKRFNHAIEGMIAEVENVYSRV